MHTERERERPVGTPTKEKHCFNGISSIPKPTAFNNEFVE